MNDKTLTVTVVGRRCVYINDYRVAGSKPYVSENLPSWSFEADINDLRYAIGRRPSSANKALQARIEALLADNAKLREALRVYAGPMEWSQEPYWGVFPVWADGYPGGVYIDENTLDFGEAARAALQETGQ